MGFCCLRWCRSGPHPVRLLMRVPFTLLASAATGLLMLLALGELAHHPVTNSGSQPFIRPIGPPGPPLPP